MPRDREDRDAANDNAKESLFSLGQDTPTENAFEYKDDEVNLVPGLQGAPRGTRAAQGG
jgi:hypothetical protein